MPVTVINRDSKEEYLNSETSKELISISGAADWQKITQLCYEITNIQDHRNKEICLSFCEASEIQELNRNFRNKDKVTDVLSFNASPIKVPEGEIEALGDIIICTERAAEQAKEFAYSLRRELIFLFIHGVLHLLGFDDETEDEAKEMFDFQKQVLISYGILD